MRKAYSWTLIVAALGYFVDMFDLTMFSVVRVASLKDLGITDPAQITDVGVMLLNLQALGMLIGGVIWGVLGDKRGRLSILFGSIFLYSIANVLNAFVDSIPQYAALRFIAGIGLAGELGAAVTLVSETMSKEKRGYGTAIIATLGLLGAVAASILGQAIPWKTCYLIGGCMGLVLLALRFKMVDSEMFHKVYENAPRGDLRLLLTGDRFKRYLLCVLVGVPVYFGSGILFTFAPEFASGLGIEGVTAGYALLFGCFGLTVGDLICGFVSQWIKSRKRAIYGSLTMGFVAALTLLNATGVSVPVFYTMCFFMGLAGGYWAVLITIAAEQFGTNIRATVATSVPNVIRSSVIIMTISFSIMKSSMGVINAALLIGAVVFVLAGMAIYMLKETFAKDLDFVETKAGPNSSSSASQPKRVSA